MKRAIKIIMTGICLGLALVFLQHILTIDEKVFLRGYWIIALTLLITVVLINLFYNFSYLKKIRKAVLLLEEERPQEYIEEIKKLLKTAKGKNLQNILALNLAAGYVEIHQFDTAIAMLEELSDKQLKGSSILVVHRINLCISYFETAQYEKAKAVYDNNQQLFQKYRNSKIYGANIIILDIMAAIIQKQYALAEELLEVAYKTYDTPRFQKSFQEISDTLRKLTNISSQH